VRDARGGTAGPPVPGRVVRWGLYALLASIPFEIPHRSTLPVEVPTLFGAIFLLTALLQPRVAFRKPPTAFWSFAGFLYIFALAASLNFLNDQREVLQLFLLILQNVLIFWAAYNVLRDEHVTTNALVVYVTACVIRAILPIVGIGRTTRTVWTGGERWTWLGQNENNSAMFMAAGLIILVGLTYGRTRSAIRPRLLAWPAAALLADAIVRTGSRGGLATLTTGLLVFLLLNHAPSLRLRIRNAAVGLVALALLLWGAYASPVMRDRLADTAENGAMAGRETLYPVLMQMFFEKPLLGWGPLNNDYELSLREMYVSEGEKFLFKRDTHNLMLETLTSTGVIGTLVFWPGILLCLLAAWRARAGPEGILPLSLLLGLLIANMSGNYIGSKVLWVAMAVALAGYEHARGLAHRPQRDVGKRASVTQFPHTRWSGPEGVRSSGLPRTL
jgi:O-antigen ligase